MSTRRPARRKKKFNLKRIVNTLIYRSSFFDYSLLFIVLFLVAFGLVIVYSTSSYSGQLQHGNSAFFLIRQGRAAIVGLVALFIFSNLDYHIWKKFAKVFMIFILFLLLFVAVFGVASHGASRWLNIGGASLQPSEFAKIILIMYMAQACTAWSVRITDIKVVARVAAAPMVAVALIATENLSTAIICAAIVFIMIFITSPKWKQFFIIAGAVIGLMGFFLMIASYRLDRIKIWLHPEKYEKGYQTLQALYAIGSGGFFGKGLGQSIQKLGFIPESHNDYIFSVVCEELGLFGAVCVILLFALLIWRCVMIAMSAPDLYGALLVVGVVTHVAVQVIVNIAVVTKTIPPTGVPLPFISYGGTALLGLFAEMGLVLSVAKQINIPKNVD